MVMGANQENAAYPSGLCAERSAIFAAQSTHPDQPIKALAIAARNSNGLMKLPIVPCGACDKLYWKLKTAIKSLFVSYFMAQMAFTLLTL